MIITVHLTMYILTHDLQCRTYVLDCKVASYIVGRIYPRHPHLSAYCSSSDATNPMTFTIWHQPTTVASKPLGTSCLSLSSLVDGVPDCGWKNVSCTQPMPTICQRLYIGLYIAFIIDVVYKIFIII